MPFYFTRHLKKRIRQRELSREQVELAAREPDQIVPTFKGRYLAQKSFHGKILEVVCKQEEGKTVLITAYWLKEKP